MKTFLLSTGLALGLGGLALSPATAAPVVKSTVAVSPLTSEVACRTVERRRTNSYGVTKITRTRECDDYDRPSYRERRVYRERDYDPGPRRVYRERYRDERPGLSIRVN